MKKRIFAAVTAAALSASVLNLLPAYAVTYQEATVDYGNFVHIDVIDSSNEPVGVNMKLMDADGICVAKFAGDGSDGDPWNNSEIGFDPASTDNTRYEVGWADAEKYVPDGYKLLYKNERTEDESGINLLHEGETEDVMIHYIPEEEPETDLTVPANTIAFYADPDHLSRITDTTFKINSVTFHSKEIAAQPQSIMYYQTDEITGYTTIKVSYSSILAAGNSTAAPLLHDTETEYILCRLHLSEISEDYTEDGKYLYDNGTVQCEVDLVHDSEGNFSSMLIIGHSIVNMVIPDEDGYIEFYAEKNSMRASSQINFAVNNGEVKHSATIEDIAYAAEKSVITFKAPDFPDRGVNLYNVPAGSYTIEFEKLPSAYSDPGVIPITVTDSTDVKSISIRLKDYEEPDVTEPAPLPEGHTVYPEDNILNILVKNESGELIPDAEMKLQHGLIIDTFNSGGTLYDSGAADPTIKWQEIGGDPINMFIPYEDFVRASGAENAFGIKVPGWLSAQKSPVCFTAGETQDVTLYVKDAEQEADLMLPAGYYGLYTDPKWAQDSSDCTSYLYMGDEPVYLNPEDGIGSYCGISTYYTAESIGPVIYAGLCERDAEPEQKQFITKPEISTEATEFVKHRMHVSQISEDFRDDGRYLYKDWVIDPRCNTEENGCIIFIKSEGFINVVLPDENGFVEFYAEKEERYCETYIFFNFSANSSSTTRVDQTGIVATDSFTDYYTAVSLPDTGVVLTNVPAREYTLSFTSVPDDYKMPEKMTLNIEDTQGVQTIEIILQEKYTMGDIDIDGDVDLADAVLALSHYASVCAGTSSPLNVAQQVLADVNMDGNINLMDTSAILSFYAKSAAGLTPEW